MKILSISCLALALCAPAQAMDAELYQKYQAYKERQQAAQGQELEQAREALRSGDLDTAQKHLDSARNMAYAPETISALEQQIAAEKTRREQERLAKEQREQEELEQQIAAEKTRREQERLAKEQREQEEKERLAKQQEQERQASAAAYASNTTANADLEYGLDWGYSYDDIYIPPVYETQLKERGIFFREYYLETTQTMSGYTVSNLEEVYFSVKLRNPSSSSVRVTYKIKARESFSVGRAVGATASAGAWAIAGAGLLSLISGNNDADTMAAGAVLGGAYGLSRQDEQNEWFSKEKTFTVTLAPGEETYETGKFPVSKRLSGNPTLEIVRVE